MGSFFTNIHIRRGPKASLETIEATLDKLAKKNGLVRCAENAGKIDRTIIVRAGDGAWISLYDETTEDQDSAKLDVLGKALSESTQSSVVSALVHDSDVLLLGLFEHGKKVDQYDSHPAYFSGRELSPKAIEKAAGKPKLWKPLLAAGITVEKFAQVLAEKNLFAEQTLAQVAKCLDCSPERMGVGYNYLEKDKIPSQEVKIVQYTLAKRPAHEKLADGPPRFISNFPPEFEIPVPNQELAVGDELRLGVTCTNGGGPGEGVLVRVWGEPLEKELVDVTSFELLIGNPLSGAKHIRLEPVLTKEAAHKVWKAEIKAPVPAGIKGGLAALQANGDWRTMQQVMYNAQVHVNVVGNVKLPGNGRIHTAMSPLHGAEAQTYVGNYDLTIDAPLYRPLQANASSPGYGGSHVVRPLSQNEKLVALVVYGVDQAKAANHALKAFERLLAVCPSVARFESAIFYAQESRRPATGQVKTKNLAKDKRWNDIVAAAPKERQVTIEPVFDPENDDSPGDSGLGFAFGRAMSPSDTRKGKETTALLLWVHAEDLEEEMVNAIRTTLHSIIDEAMRDFAGLQGFLTRWGGPNSTLDSTLYEQAVGIQGSETMFRAWCERYLRAVGNDTLWLGSEMRKHIDKSIENDLSRFGDYADLGRYARIELRAKTNETVAQLEKHLAILLPTEEEARAFAKGT